MSADLDADVVVVGGGPVGLASAIGARLAGLSVVVVEPRRGPVDKACGEGLMPGTLTALLGLGLDPPGHVLRGISYRDARRHADHPFATGPGRGVRRTVLHAALDRRSVELGVERLERRVVSVEQWPHGVEAAGVRARWLLACDGLHSTVRRLVGLESPGRAVGSLRAPRRFGLRRHFEVAPWTDLVEVHWGRDVEAYVTPVAADLVGVALLGPPRVDFAAALTSFPALARHLHDAQPATGVKGAGPLRQRTSRRTSGRVRLVGDASGYVDALTGEGLRVGLAQAAAAIRFLDDPSGYERAWVSATRDYRVLTSGLVAWAASPLRGAVVPVAHRAPRLFGAVVERLAR
ncbi:FAD-dependent monooxygenase [Actinotalea sp. K2]|uniref:NAD(P)/FAD-dependent oxidoreductase n=1 Tax=Actinotalea sp. K2 TaxID=2939438 RepID=UPI0020170FE0|nr:FAD-dependent monooxygenase [Actinotalea sp. K2]MCL3862239.1 FAD-dependent monooxygenase [Actinotalea sp. K2]